MHELPFALLMVLCRTCCMADTVFSHATCVSIIYSGFSKIAAALFNSSDFEIIIIIFRGKHE